MFALYRQCQATLQQQRRELAQAGWAMLRAEPWRFATLPISLAVALFLKWAMSREHSPAFWWLTALGVSAVLLGSVRLSLYLRARWERKQQREENL